jgi:hypothetical protein
VETQQCAKLTGTNRPFGLTIKLSQLVALRRRFQAPQSKTLGKFGQKSVFLTNCSTHSHKSFTRMICTKLCGFAAMPANSVAKLDGPGFVPRTAISRFEPASILQAHQFSGGHTAGVTPVPIPNTEVKPRRADDTARVTVWERRSPPGLIPRAPIPNPNRSPFCFLARSRPRVAGRISTRWRDTN